MPQDMDSARLSPSPYNFSSMHPAYRQHTGIPLHNHEHRQSPGSPSGDVRSRKHYTRNTPTPSQSPPVSPQWNYLKQNVNDRAAISAPTSPIFVAYSPKKSYSTNESHRSIDSVTSDTKDKFSSLPPVRAHTTNTPMVVENFSRPRVLGTAQSSYDAPQRRSPTQLHPDTSLHDPSSWRPRSPDSLVSPNHSASALPSVSIHNQDSPRGRGTHSPPPSFRTPRPYFVRAESSGPAFARDPIPRMASLSSDELRFSGRSQYSASTSTIQETFRTERSSIMTRGGSIVSLYGNVDDNFSIDDVLGLYGKGFDDDSAPEDNESYDSRPPTATSEPSKEETADLDAVTEVATAIPLFSKGRPTFRDSTIFHHDVQVSTPLVIADDAVMEKESIGIPEAIQSHSSEEFIPSPPVRHETFLTTTGEEERDRYGFKKSNQYITIEQYDQWDSQYSKYLARRRKKWTIFLKENGLMTDAPNRFPPRSTKAKRFVRKGIPPEWRGAAWFYYAGGPAIVAKHAGLYNELLGSEVKTVDSEAIERDLHRTFPDNIRFRSMTGPGVAIQDTASIRSGRQTVAGSESDVAIGNGNMIASLRRVLRAFSVYNPRIGYCQSLNFLAGLLLLFVDTEEQAFWLLNIITRVYLPGTHEMSLEGANVDLGVLMSSIRDTMPNVWAKIGGELDGTDVVRPKSRRHRQRVELSGRLPPITLCMTAWFMSCFIGTLPIESTLRVWDVFFYEGSKTLFRIALTIFKLGESEIKTVGDPMEIFQVVQTIPRRILDANSLMEACYKRRNGFGHLSQETIELKRQERRRHVQAENQRLAAGEPVPVPDAEGRKKGMLFNRKVKD
ncbi:RabGAP/TBC [Xylaria nigripes]|nr:RabGAP/TBC [Xylaria nigripes]